MPTSSTISQDQIHIEDKEAINLEFRLVDQVGKNLGRPKDLTIFGYLYNGNKQDAQQMIDAFFDSTSGHWYIEVTERALGNDSIFRVTLEGYLGRHSLFKHTLRVDEDEIDKVNEIKLFKYTIKGDPIDFDVFSGVKNIPNIEKIDINNSPSLYYEGSTGNGTVEELLFARNRWIYIILDYDQDQAWSKQIKKSDFNPTKRELEYNGIDAEPMRIVIVSVEP